MEHYARLSGEKSFCSRSFSFFVNKASSESLAGQGASRDEEAASDDGTDDEFDIDKHITDVLDGVGLTKEKDTIVGGAFQRGLSGGQKRRLSVALEALSNPLNLFLDEPTVRI
ncbi:MAG: ATPase subunit of ABC transporter with duplicated ATPase domains [Bacillariaceae sp.]|jgi:ATPase subunit of ABC transporter with duplicated ATPase domains